MQNLKRPLTAFFSTIVLFSLIGCKPPNIPLIIIPQKLEFSIQPTDTTAGDTILIEVVAYDDDGQLIESLEHEVELILQSHHENAELKGQLRTPLINGKAYFDNLLIENAGSDYIITAVTPGAPPLDSNNFAVSANIAAEIRFLSSPESGTPEAPLSPVITVAVTDEYGNPVTGHETTIDIQAQLSDNQTIELFGTLTKTTTRGIARFKGLTLEHGFDEVYLRASSNDFGNAVSRPVTIGRRITFENLDVTRGLHAPSIARDPDSDRLWMTYSEVDTSISELPRISTRLAFSDNEGMDWQDAGVVINPSTIETSPPSFFKPPELAITLPATWWHDVSNLAYNPHAPADQRWMLVWHRYLYVYDANPDTEDRHFAFGWIATKSSATPEGLVYATEEKLFAGSAYDFHTIATDYNDAIAGGTPIRLNTLDGKLSSCLVFTEPSLLSLADGMYISLDCFPSPEDNQYSVRTILLKRAHNSLNWTFSGTLLEAEDAKKIIGIESYFNASELVERNGRHYLITTLSVSQSLGQRSCLAFEFEDINTAMLKDPDNNGLSLYDVSFYAAGTENSNNGGCTYHANTSHERIIYGEMLEHTPQFRIYSAPVSFPEHHQ